MLEELRDTFDRLLADGREPGFAACTYEYRCGRCETVTYHNCEGGQLDGGCEPHCAADDVYVHTSLAGRRECVGTLADFAGRR